MTQKKDSCLINLEKDTPIFRIVRLDFLINDILSKSLTLPRVLSWEDSYEAAYFRGKLYMGNINTQIEHLGLDWFGQCWSTVSESDAMWRIYNPSHDRIRVASTVGKLFDAIFDTITKNQPDFANIAKNHLFLGTVEYRTEKEIVAEMEATHFHEVAKDGLGRPWAELFLSKRDAFAHEHEVRLLYQKSYETTYRDDDYLSSKSYREFITNGESEFLEAFIHIPVCWETVIDSVMIGPQASDETEQLIRKKLRAAAEWIKVEKSSMYRTPIFNIKF